MNAQDFISKLGNHEHSPLHLVCTGFVHYVKQGGKPETSDELGQIAKYNWENFLTLRILTDTTFELLFGVDDGLLILKIDIVDDESLKARVRSMLIPKGELLDVIKNKTLH
jgi:hypothetical protein